MAKSRDPGKHSKKDPAKPTRAKAARPPLAPIAPELEKLLNPGIDAGTAGPGSQTGLKPPPDNSWDRRADFARAHTARKSTPKGFNEAAQSGYVAKTPPGELDPDLAKALGIEEDDEASHLPSPSRGGVGGTTSLPGPPPLGGKEPSERDESAEIFSPRSLRAKRSAGPAPIVGIASQTAL